MNGRGAILLVMLSLVISAGTGHGALGDFETFYPTRDTSVSNYPDEMYGNGGRKRFARLSKYNYSENYMCDFDKQAIRDWLGAHPLAAGEQYEVKFRFFTASGWKDDYAQGLWRIEFTTLNMPAGVDWIEGDGDCPDPAGCLNFNYSSGLPGGATSAYAVQVWRPVSYVKTVDVDNSVQWTLPDGTPVSSYSNQPGLHLYTNSQALIYYWNDPDILPFSTDFFITLDFDPTHPQGVHPMPLFNDFLYEPQNKGLSFGWIRKWDEATQSWVFADQNFCLCTENFNGLAEPGVRPYVRLEVVPEPHLVLAILGGLGFLRRKRWSP